MSCIRHTCPSRLEHVAIASSACAAGFNSDMQTSPFGVCPSRRPGGHVGLATSARSPALQQTNGASEKAEGKVPPSMLGPQLSLLVLKYRSLLVPPEKLRSPIQSKQNQILLAWLTMTVLEHNSRHTAALEGQNVFRAQAQKVIASAHPRSVVFASIEASLGRRTGCKALEADALVRVASEVRWSQYHCTFRSSQCFLGAGRREGSWDRRGTAASPGCFQRVILAKGRAIVVPVAAAKETKSR
eukprot:scaffold5478_cov134-Pinguiococcus_pyrenoidosus.AAC.1